MRPPRRTPALRPRAFGGSEPGTRVHEVVGVGNCEVEGSNPLPSTTH